MAEGFPSVILDSVLKQLESPIFRRIKIHIHLRTQFRELQSNLEIINEVIDEAELMGVLFPDMGEVWGPDYKGIGFCKLRELQNVLYEVDDLLAEVLTRSTPASGMVEKVRLHLYNMSFPKTLAPKIKKINRSLDDIVGECRKCNLLVVKRGGPSHPSDTGEHDKLVARKGILRYNPDYVRDDNFQMIGRDDDKKKVIQILFNEDCLNIVGIFGDAGVGKTTLCRAVFSDEEVSNHFESVHWVGGFIAYSPIEFLERIARKLGVDGPYFSDTGYSDISKTMRDLEGKIANKLNETDILLILDDVPTDILKSLLRFQSYRTRSRILMSSLGDGSSTDEILSYVTDDLSEEWFQLRNICYLYGDDLSEEHMLSLFENTAFGSSCYRFTEWFPEEWMRGLGKEIVRRCPRNPSLLKGVATLLCGERDMNVWQKFAREFDFERQYRYYNKFRKVFGVLAKCQQNVGYLSLFPSSVEFKFDDLIHQFAAHGFTPLSNPVREVLEATICSPTGAEGMCTVDEDYYTDAIRGVPRAVSNMLGCTDTADAHQVAGRHVAISSSRVQQQNGKLPDDLLKHATHRRSLLLFGDDSVPAVIRVQALTALFSRLRNLRVLSLQDLRLRVLPSSIGRLIHLKYLDLSGNNFVGLPASVGTLALWTLKLTYCSELKWFPSQITNLRTLKHLEVNMCLDLIHMPSIIAQLTGLESLDRFVVGSREGGLRYLENLNKLSGHLSIELPRRWKNSAKDLKQMNLRSKTGLTSLELKWHGAYGDGDGNDYNVLEQLKPCTNIEKISLFNYGGTKLSDCFTSSSYRLTKITICRCARCEILPPFQNMPMLKCLTLVSLDRIEYIIRNDEGNDGVLPVDVVFRSLSVITIGKMPMLKRWSRNSYRPPIFPNLLSLEIWDCPSAIHMRPLPKVYPFDWVGV